MKLPHVNKKPIARKRIFVQTPYSHSSLKLERKIVCEQISKQTAPQYNSNSLNCKKGERLNNSRLRG